MNKLPSLPPASAAAAPLALTPETPPLSCARQLILERAYEMARFEEGTRAGNDIEVLHDMRVWSRRLREALEIFAFCFPPKMYDRLYERVRQVTRALGRSRNADVAVKFFAAHHAQAREATEQFALEDLLRRLVKEQSRERERMQARLNKKARARDLPVLLEASFLKITQTPGLRRRGPRTAWRLARALLSARVQEVFKIRAAITGEDDVEGLHRLRIAVKKLRYALEILGFAIGEPAEENLIFFKKLQTVLGDLHDRDVFIALVKERQESLQKQVFATHLLAGYEKIFVHLAQERHQIHEDYFQIFGGARLVEWRKRVVPPLPKKTTSQAASPAESAVAPDSPS
jgi:CHAD domain-containing protein